MGKLKQLFEKIKKYLRKLLRQEPILLLENKEEVIIENEDAQENKKDFFELYEKVKNGKVSMDHLLIDDLLKVMLIMKQENDILEKRVIEEKNLNKEMDSKIVELQYSCKISSNNRS